MDTGTEKHIAQTLSEICTELKRLRKAILLQAKAVMAGDNDLKQQPISQEIDKLLSD